MMINKINDFCLTHLIKFMDKNTEKKLLLLSSFFYMIAYSEKSKRVARQIRFLFKNKHPYLQWWVKVIKNLDIDIKKKFIENLFINSFNGKYIKKRKSFKRKYGFMPPYSLIMSITSDCNYSCKGCWAKKYEDKSEMSYEKWKEILTEARDEMGIFSVYITGGEPFMREDFYKLAEEFSDCLFFTYTNGSLLTDETIGRIKELGNVYPMISINGLEANNDEHRGAGTYVKAFEKMEKLTNAGIFWGTSTVATKKNIDTICSQDFYKMFSDKGAFWMWIFAYMPSGDESDFEYMLSAEQTLKMHHAVYEARNSLPIVAFDIYDAYELGGCTAAGNRFVHISANGDVEPCPFIHLSVSNLKNTTLKDAVGSSFLSEIRKNIPYDGNCLRPCLIIDRPEILKRYFEKFQPSVTQKDFLNLLYNPEMYDKLYQSAQTAKPFLDEAWEKKECLGFYPYTK